MSSPADPPQDAAPSVAPPPDPRAPSPGTPPPALEVSASGDRDNMGGGKGNGAKEPRPPGSPSPRRTLTAKLVPNSSVQNQPGAADRTSSPTPHQKLNANDRVESLPNLKAPARPKPISPKPEMERSLSLKNIGDAMKSLVTAEPSEDKTSNADVPAPVKDETQKPFPGVPLHVVKPAEAAKPVFPGIPLHLMIEDVAETPQAPKPVFPGLRLHVIDEAGQRRTYVTKEQPGAKAEAKNTSPRGASAAILPKELEIAKSKKAGTGSPRKMILVPSSGQHAMQGHRPNMEDAHVWLDCLRDDVPSLPWDGRFAFYAVYDGHAGNECAHMIRPLVHRAVVASPDFAAGRVAEAIRAGFEQVDKQIIERACREGWKAGATAVVAFLVNNMLFVANVGDSELVVARRKKGSGGPLEAHLLTAKHKPGMADERKRIEAAGGTVVFGRLFGELAVSRAFGDKDFKRPTSENDYLSIEPHQVEVKLDPQWDEFMVLACDGLWDKVTYQEAVDMVRDWRSKGKSPDQCAQLLNDVSFQRHSKDNISTVVVFFNWKPEAQDLAEREKHRNDAPPALDLSAPAPYTPSKDTAPSTPTSDASHSPEVLSPVSADDALRTRTPPGGRKPPPALVRSGRSAMTAYTVSPSSSASSKGLLASASSDSQSPSSSPSSPLMGSPRDEKLTNSGVPVLEPIPSQSSDSSGQSEKDGLREGGASPSRLSMGWEHTVSQTVHSIVQEKKATLSPKERPA